MVKNNAIEEMADKGTPKEIVEAIYLVGQKGGGESQDLRRGAIR